MSAPREAADQAAPPRYPAFDQLVILIANQEGMAERIVGQHTDDGSGHCRLCTSGAQTGNYRWPCQTYLAARGATDLRIRGVARTGQRA